MQFLVTSIPEDYTCRASIFSTVQSVNAQPFFPVDHGLRIRPGFAAALSAILFSNSMDRWPLVLFSIGLPVAGCAMIAFAYYLLIHAIPSLGTDNTKPRTDLHCLRAGYASFVVGVAILGLWAIGVAVIGVTAELLRLFS